MPVAFGGGHRSYAGTRSEEWVGKGKPKRRGNDTPIYPDVGGLAFLHPQVAVGLAGIIGTWAYVEAALPDLTAAMMEVDTAAVASILSTPVAARDTGCSFEVGLAEQGVPS